MQQYSVQAKFPMPLLGSLTDCLIAHAKSQPHTPTIVRRDGDIWTDLSAAQFLEEVRAIARGLAACGIRPGDRVAIMSRTRYEWTVTDYAIWYAGCVTVPIYETSSAEQMQWILSDSQSVAVLVESDAHLQLLHGIRHTLPDLAHSWVFDRQALAEIKAVGIDFDDQEIDRRRDAVKAEDLATIIYTSGTTGRPKGCSITHSNFMFMSRSVIAAAPEIFADRTTSTLLFLPLAHVFGRIIEIAMVEAGLKMAFAPNITNLMPDLAVFRPNFLLAVPRVFEKVYNGAAQKATADGKGKIFDRAAESAIAYSRAIAEGKIPLGLKMRHALFDKLVFAKLRHAMGGEVRWSVSGGAALGERLGHFFRGIGLTILEGYGLTETSAASTVNLPQAIKVGSVGRPIPGVSIAIAADGEVLTKGPHIFAGYWNNPQATSDAIDSDGWFHTGDIGTIDDDGFLYITGRKKELIVTAGGKNVAPAVIEDRLRAHWLVSQCMVVGDAKPFVACLITIDHDSLPQWLSRHGLSADTTIETLRHNAEFIADIQEAVDTANQSVSKAESIRKWDIVDSDWSVDSGHLTPSLKLKRNIVHDQYADRIEALYTGETS